jgi:hypothetical protein
MREFASVASEPAWRKFQAGLWQHEINVRDFIQQNYEPYHGDGGFLAPATPRTQEIWARLGDLFVEERRKGVLDISPIPTGLPDAYRRGRIIGGEQQMDVINRTFHGVGAGA